MTVKQLHHQAMYYCDREMLGQALQFEIEAGRMLPIERKSEPTRSILFRSAATIALYDLGNKKLALVLIELGMTEYTPKVVLEELEEIKEIAEG